MAVQRSIHSIRLLHLRCAVSNHARPSSMSHPNLLTLAAAVRLRFPACCGTPATSPPMWAWCRRCA